MGLYKRGEVWWMSFTCEGRHIRRSTETTDKDLAKRIFDKLKGQVAERKWFEQLPGEDIPFRKMMEKYLEEHSLPNKSRESHKRDKSIVKNLVRAFGNLMLTNIGPRDIAAYKVERRREGASPRTINYELTVMGHAFKIAMREWEWVRENPVSRVSKEKVRNQIERWLKPDEEARLLKASAEWLRDIIMFAINTGFRQSEILDLKWPQIDFERRTVTISEQKNDGVDTLPLNRTVLDVLKGREASSHGSELVFPDESGKRMGNRYLQKAFTRLVKGAGIAKFRFHDLRHTFATKLVQRGVDLYTVQKLGRWKTVSMVMRYAHHYPESLRPGIEAMDDARKKSVTILSQSPKFPPKRKGHKPHLRLVTL